MKKLNYESPLIEELIAKTTLLVATSTEDQSGSIDPMPGEDW